ISGTVAPGAGGGSQIAVKMALHPFVLVFMCFWLGVVAMASIAFFVSFLGRTPSEGSSWGVLGPPAMFLFAWALSTGSFTVESRKATQLLIELLGASKVSSAPTS